MDSRPPCFSLSILNLFEVSGHDLGGRSVVAVVETTARAFEVQFHGPRAAGLGGLVEAGRGIDIARSSDGEEQIASGKRVENFIHVERHFAKPHHIWTQPARSSTTGAYGLGEDIFAVVEYSL